MSEVPSIVPVPSLPSAPSTHVPFWRRHMRKALYAAMCSMVGIYELQRTQEAPLLQPEQTVVDMQARIETCLQKKYKWKEVHTQSAPIAPATKTQVQMQAEAKKAWNWTVQKLPQWVLTYQNPEACTEEKDCNDTAVRTADALLRHGIPTYIVSIRPLRAVDKNLEWHQVVVIKLEDDMYIVLDSNLAPCTVHGTLVEYFAMYDVPMQLVEYVGISEYAIPVYKNPLSRMLVQVRNAVSEVDMQPSLVPDTVVQLAKE